MSDRRTCAGGHWQINEYGRWCPSCMEEIASLRGGLRVFINDMETPIVVVREAIRDLDGNVEMNPIVSLDIDDIGHIDGMVHRVLDTQDGTILKNPSCERIWTYHIDGGEG